MLSKDQPNKFEKFAFSELLLGREVDGRAYLTKTGDTKLANKSRMPTIRIGVLQHWFAQTSTRLDISRTYTLNDLRFKNIAFVKEKGPFYNGGIRNLGTLSLRLFASPDRRGSPRLSFSKCRFAEINGDYLSLSGIRLKQCRLGVFSMKHAQILGALSLEACNFFAAEQMSQFSHIESDLSEADSNFAVRPGLSSGMIISANSTPDLVNAVRFASDYGLENFIDKQLEAAVEDDPENSKSSLSDGIGNSYLLTTRNVDTLRKIDVACLDLKGTTVGGELSLKFTNFFRGRKEDQRKTLKPSVVLDDVVVHGSLKLQGTVVRGAISAHSCDVQGDVYAPSVDWKNQFAPILMGRNLSVKNRFYLSSNSSEFEGSIFLPGLECGGTFEVSDSEFVSTIVGAGTHKSLVLAGSVLNNGILLNNCHFFGGIEIPDTRCGGSLIFRNCKVESKDKSLTSINAQGSSFAGSVQSQFTEFKGRVSFKNSTIKGDLGLDACHIYSGRKDPKIKQFVGAAFDADGANVNGDIVLRRSRFNGQVSLNSAACNGSVKLLGTKHTAVNQFAFSADSINVGGDFVISYVPRGSAYSDKMTNLARSGNPVFFGSLNMKKCSIGGLLRIDSASIYASIFYRDRNSRPETLKPPKFVAGLALDLSSSQVGYHLEIEGTNRSRARITGGTVLDKIEVGGDLTVNNCVISLFSSRASRSRNRLSAVDIPALSIERATINGAISLGQQLPSYSNRRDYYFKFICNGGLTLSSTFTNGGIFISRCSLVPSQHAQTINMQKLKCGEDVIIKDSIIKHDVILNQSEIRGAVSVNDIRAYEGYCFSFSEGLCQAIKISQSEVSAYEYFSSLSLIDLAVSGDVSIQHIKAASPLHIDMSRTNVGKCLHFSGITYKHKKDIPKGHFSLANASAAQFSDMAGNAWYVGKVPAFEIDVTGFKYNYIERFRGRRLRGIKRHADRLDWLKLQTKKRAKHQTEQISSQPYEYLARFYRERGDSHSSRLVIQRLKKKQLNHKSSFILRGINSIFGWLYGFGYSPNRAFITMVTIGIIGFCLSYFSIVLGEVEAVGSNSCADLGNRLLHSIPAIKELLAISTGDEACIYQPSTGSIFQNYNLIKSSIDVIFTISLSAWVLIFTQVLNRNIRRS